MKAIICGAGAAGLASAATLMGLGLDVIVLECTNNVGASWRSRYDGLRLNTTGWMSQMPGYPASRQQYGEFPSRDAWVRYLEDYTGHHRIPVRFGTKVRKVLAAESGWRVETDGGDLTCDIVVVATGSDHDPCFPDWHGRERFTGELLHASAYRNPEPYRGRDVLVVGPNVTGSEIANYLVKGGAARVRVACRTPPNFTKRKVLGISLNIIAMALSILPLRIADALSWLTQWIIFGSLKKYGLPRSPEGAFTTIKRRLQAPAYDDGFIAELKAGRIEIVAAVTGFDGKDVMLADGKRIRPDVVIAATGYRRALEEMVGHLDVLDGDGRPTVGSGQEHPLAPGLFFNGYRADVSGQLRLMRLDAIAIAQKIRCKLQGRNL